MYEDDSGFWSVSNPPSSKEFAIKFFWALASLPMIITEAMLSAPLVSTIPSC